jgi:hypothetical protein
MMTANSFGISTIFRVLVIISVTSTSQFLHYDLSGPYILLLGLLIILFAKIQRSYLKLILPLIAILVIEFVGVDGHELKDILRDIVFVLAPISLIFIGYWIANDKALWSLFLKIFVIMGFFLACIHIGIIAQDPNLLNSNSLDIRKTAGSTGDLVVIGFILGLFQKQYEANNFFPKLLPRFIVMPVLLASIALSFSRTQLVVTIIMFLSMLGWLPRINRRLLFSISLLMAIFFVTKMVTPANEEGTFRSKIINSISEITISDYSDYSDINQKWRGFESQRGVEEFLSGNFLQHILGQGLGHQIDLGFYIPLGGDGDVEFRFIPILHNGYIYILVKAGILGLICYALFYLTVIKFAVRKIDVVNEEQRFIARMLIGSVFSLISSMYVIGGMAEMHSLEMLMLLGFLMRRMEQLQLKNNRIMTGKAS